MGAAKKKSAGRGAKAGAKSGRGVKIDERIKVKAQIMLATGDTVSFVCETLGLADSTVRSWQKALQNDEEFAKVRDNILNKRLNEYMLKAMEAQGAALDIMVKKLETAIVCEEKRKELIDKLLASKKDGEAELSTDEIKKAVSLLLPESLGDISRTFALLTEKVALMSGRPTVNVEHSGALGIKKFEDL